MDQQEILVGALAIAFLALSLSIHEACHAFVAYRAGDTTAKEMGRLTLNPMAHIDPFMTVLVPLLLYLTVGFVFGGAKPVPVNPQRLRSPHRDMMLVALAGPVSNFLLALLFMVILKVVLLLGAYQAGDLLPTVLGQAVYFNILLAVFNLFPIPPLDGSRVMAYVLPQSLRENYVALERFGLMLVVALVFFVPGFQQVLWAGMQTCWAAIDYLTGGDWA